MVTHNAKKNLIIFLVLLLLSLASCTHTKPEPVYAPLIKALVSKNKAAIIQHKSSIEGQIKSMNLVHLYLLAIDEKPQQVIDHSQVLIENLHHYNLNQQVILKGVLMWSYAQVIYRHETAQQVRLLQKERLMVAPTEVPFDDCLESEAVGCSPLRGVLSQLSGELAMNALLYTMARNDPCINLSQSPRGGVYADDCLAIRQGVQRVNLLSIPSFLSDQWEAALEPL